MCVGIYRRAAENHAMQPDRLAELCQMQATLKRGIGVDTDNMAGEERTKWVLNYTRAMTQEIAQLTGP